MKTVTLYLKQNLPFASAPVCAELPLERVLCNHVIFAGEFNPHNVRLWVLGNEYGAMGAVWADCEQDAIDELINADMAAGILVDEKDCCPANCGENMEDCEHGHGGNAGEAYCADHLWMAPVVFEPTRDLPILLKFAEARGANVDNLDKL